MKPFFRFLFLLVIAGYSMAAMAQTTAWKEMYKVKKKDTMYGIARQYGITVEELVGANPEMGTEGYQLKKGDYIFIPYAKNENKPLAGNAPAADDLTKRAIRVGIMLPLHNVDGDGRRMVEYYRGILMACDSLKAKGISTDIHAWNVPIDADIRQTLLEKDANRCDIIFGPLYTRQVKPLGDFCKTYGIKMVIPFSINGNEVASNPQIFQVYQSPQKQNEDALRAFLERFPTQHVVFIDCNDSTSRKGIFTMELRKRLEARGQAFNITNLRSSDEQFSKAFSRTVPNVVVLNTGRSPELNNTLARMNALIKREGDIPISMFGYTEWLMYTGIYQPYFHRYDAYIPTAAYYNETAPATQQLEQAYQRWFKAEMQYALPRFAITGYDQAQFFLRGLHEKGKAFKGTKGESSYQPLQTPLKFRQVGTGGMQNENFMLIHYKPNKGIESINY